MPSCQIENNILVIEKLSLFFSCNIKKWDPFSYELGIVFKKSLHIITRLSTSFTYYYYYFEVVTNEIWHMKLG